MSDGKNEHLERFFNSCTFHAAYNKKAWHASDQSLLDYYTELFYEYMKMFDLPWHKISLPGDTAEHSLFNEVFKESETKAREIGQGIIEALKLCLLGRRHEGFMVFSGCLHSISHFDPIIDTPLNKNRYFRIRKINNTTEIDTANDMFHIPFSKRHQVREYRYSILGYPCLYLASSLYTCWEELMRPSFNSIVLSRYEPTDSYDKTKVLFLGMAPVQFKEEIEGRVRVAQHDPTQDNIEKFRHDFKCLKSYFEFWPLQLACSIPTKHPNGVFHEEYIIPQFLMEWIRNADNVNGICYRTSKVPQMSAERMFPGLLYNYAFPVRSTSTDYCTELSHDFLLTPPISFELTIASRRMEQTHGGGFYNSNPKVDGFSSLPIPFTLPEGISTQYKATDFFVAEYNSACDTAISLL